MKTSIPWWIFVTNVFLKRNAVSDGMGQQMYGKAGQDKIISVPIGTVVINVQTDEVIGDMVRHGDRLLVAKEAQAA